MATTVIIFGNSPFRAKCSSAYKWNQPRMFENWITKMTSSLKQRFTNTNRSDINTRTCTLSKCIQRWRTLCMFCVCVILSLCVFLVSPKCQLKEAVNGILKMISACRRPLLRVKGDPPGRASSSSRCGRSGRCVRAPSWDTCSRTAAVCWSSLPSSVLLRAPWLVHSSILQAVFTLGRRAFHLFQYFFVHYRFTS